MGTFLTSRVLALAVFFLLSAVSAFAGKLNLVSKSGTWGSLTIRGSILFVDTEFGPLLLKVESAKGIQSIVRCHSLDADHQIYSVRDNLWRIVTRHSGDQTVGVIAFDGATIQMQTAGGKTELKPRPLCAWFFYTRRSRVKASNRITPTEWSSERFFFAITRLERQYQHFLRKEESCTKTFKKVHLWQVPFHHSASAVSVLLSTSFDGMLRVSTINLVKDQAGVRKVKFGDLFRGKWREPVRQMIYERLHEHGWGLSGFPHANPRKLRPEDEYQLTPRNLDNLEFTANQRGVQIHMTPLLFCDPATANLETSYAIHIPWDNLSAWLNRAVASGFQEADFSFGGK
jgi:hypothetical protein